MNHRQQHLLKQTREVLQQQVENLPADVSRQLHQARNRALAELAPQQSRLFYPGMRWAALALLMLMVGVGVWLTVWHNHDALLQDEGLLMVKEQSLSPEEIELLENLEFYQWLAQQRQG